MSKTESQRFYLLAAKRVLEMCGISNAQTRRKAIMIKFKPFERITSQWVIFSIEQVLALMSVAAAFLITHQSVTVSHTVSDIITLFISNAIITGISMMIFKTHSGIIRYSELRDIYTVVKFATLQFLIWMAVQPFISEIFHSTQAARMIIFLNSVFCTTLMVGFRLLVKEVYSRAVRTTIKKENVLIYGASDIGLATKKAIELDNKTLSNIIAFIDDAPEKIGKKLSGKLIVSGTISKLEEFIHHNKITELILAVNVMSVEKKSALTSLCSERGIRIRTIPPLNEWIDGVFNSRQLRELTIESLLNRDAIQVVNQHTRKEFSNATIMVTGAAGSIGSEICRQLCQFGLKKLILLDQAETGLHDINNELSEINQQINIHLELASVRDRENIFNIMNHHRPDFVFHAAAYKHVPILEYFPTEVVKTNVLGTKNVADAAYEYNVRKFVMISTDKAVNPTNLMGACKRIAEMYVQGLSEKSLTQFITTRFGNVLGSNGSVVPLFKKQIEAGGPVTVTHPDITRYFMTIPEASNLVLEAAVIGKGGEIFVFDMGEPVKILDLAKKMIELSGQRPEIDIPIVFNGLRPGEKMHEELFKETEHLLATHHPKIMKARRSVIHEDYTGLLEGLLDASENMNAHAIRNQIRKLVPEYNLDNSYNIPTSEKPTESKTKVVFKSGTQPVRWFSKD